MGQGKHLERDAVELVNQVVEIGRKLRQESTPKHSIELAQIARFLDHVNRK